MNGWDSWFNDRLPEGLMQSPQALLPVLPTVGLSTFVYSFIAAPLSTVFKVALKGGVLNPTYFDKFYAEMLMEGFKKMLGKRCRLIERTITEKSL